VIASLFTKDEAKILTAMAAAIGVVGTKCQYRM
jgi:hypothetical protein